MTKRRYAFWQVLFYIFFAAYLLLLAQSLLFKQVSPLTLFDADRTVSRTLQLVPFKTILEYTHFNVFIAVMNVVGNIVLFIPLGLYLQMFKRNKKVLHSAAIVFAVSLCVEAVQYGLGIGRADIDDVLLNLSGGLSGIFLYRLIYLLLKDETRTRTAVTAFFCFVSVSCTGCYLFFVYVLGYRIKIF